jgi:hypothetical protein
MASDRESRPMWFPSLLAAALVTAGAGAAAGVGCGSNNGASTSAASLDGGVSADGATSPDGSVPDEAGGGGNPPTDGGIGAACSMSERAPCAGEVCLVVGDAGTGLCSALCSAASAAVQCGPEGACVLSGDAGGYCFRTCTGASGCVEGTPCLWSAAFDAGLCEPISPTLCTDIASEGTCQTCLGTKCCGAITACIEDVGCNQLESACAGNPACANTLAGSSNTAAKALGTCAVSNCAAACQ